MRFWTVSVSLLAVFTLSLPGQGALEGRTIFLNPHGGFGFDGSEWRSICDESLGLQEGDLTQQMATLIAERLQRAGATVVPVRPFGQQPQEVVLDNEDPGVVFDPPSAWLADDAPNFYGEEGGVDYRYAFDSPQGDATATYTPDIPSAGWYPVYVWADNSVSASDGQVYRVRHTAGVTERIVDHSRLGHGWVWLGTFHFEAGAHEDTGSVQIVNRRPPGGPLQRVALADAIRFGNGMGDVEEGGETSGQPREREYARAWVERGWGNDGSTGPGMWDLENHDEISDAEGVAARLSSGMRLEDGQGNHAELLLTLMTSTSDCGSTRCESRGVSGLFHDTDPIVSQEDVALTLAMRVHSALASVWPGWESNVPLVRPDADLSLQRQHLRWPQQVGQPLLNSVGLSMGHRDNAEDALMLLDPDGQALIARAVVQGLIDHFAEVDGGDSTYPPEPPQGLHFADGGEGKIALNWQPSVSGFPQGDPATGYRVYRSRNGESFGWPLELASTEWSVEGLASEERWLCVTAVNEGGESLPSAPIEYTGTILPRWTGLGLR